MESGQLEYLFYSAGYDKIPTNLPEYTFYFRNESQGVTVIFVVDYRDGIYISEDQYTHMKAKGAEFFRARGATDIHMLSLILSADAQMAKKLCVTDSFCWMIDTGSNRLIIHENQVGDFYGWKTILEEFLAQPAPYIENPDTAAEGRNIPEKRWTKERLAKMPWVNICLVAVNVIIFLICTFTGDLLYNKGEFSVAEIIEDGSFYRMITSMFLHWDVQHLFSNMIVLYYVGEMVEKKLGHIPYAALYFLSGIAGDVFSMGYEFWLGEYYSSVGASGAVFGVEGALFLLVILNHGKLEYMTVGRVAFAIMFSLYSGFTATNINNAAHIGGVLMGFAVTAVIMIMRPQIIKGKDKGFNEN